MRRTNDVISRRSLFAMLAALPLAAAAAVAAPIRRTSAVGRVIGIDGGGSGLGVGEYVMPAPIALRLAVEVHEDVAALRERLSRLFGEIVPGPVEILERVRGFPGTAAALDFDRLPTMGAGELRIILQLSRSGSELLSALRAVEVPADLIGKSRHDLSSVGCVDNSNEDRTPGESQGSPGVCLCSGGRAE